MKKRQRLKYDLFSPAYLSNIRFILASVNLTKCLEERLDALNKLSQDRPLLGIFVPNCDPDGQYEDKQCHELYCWCVREDGARIPGTTVRGNSVVCNPQGKTCLSADSAIFYSIEASYSWSCNFIACSEARQMPQTMERPKWNLRPSWYYV